MQGLFHLRWGSGEAIPIYGPKDPHGCADLYRNPGVLDFRPGLKPFRPLLLKGLTVTPVPLNHSKPTLGYCLDGGGQRLAYLTDTLRLPAETERFLRDWRPDVVVLDATHPAAHAAPRNHNNLAPGAADPRAARGALRLPDPYRPRPGCRAAGRDHAAAPPPRHPLRPLWSGALARVAGHVPLLPDMPYSR